MPYRSYARSEIKQRRKAFRRHWPLLAAIAVGFSVLSGLMIKILVGDAAIPAWLIGPAMVLSVAGIMRTHIDGTYHLQSSVEAEGWTSTDLRKALGPGWYVIDGLSFGSQGDVDHVVVGPSGLFSVETKYTDSSMDSRTGRALIRTWIEQSHANARRVRLLLKHNYGHELDVSASVVVSGTEFLKLTADVEGTEIVRRRELKTLTSEWRNRSSSLSPQEVESVRAALLDYRGLREDFERT